MKRLIFILGLAILLKACTIIDDSDITDPNGNFRLTGISLIQNSQDGTRNLGKATIVHDDKGRIDSIIWIGVSNTNDFRFRTGKLDPLVGLQGSGITTSSTQSGTITTSFFYNTNGSILSINNRLNGKLFEAYIFTYDFQGRIQKMVTFYGDGDNPCLINQVDCGGAALLLIDSIAYSGRKIDYIRRLINTGTFKSTSAFYVAYGIIQNSCGGSGSVADDELAAVAVRDFSLITVIPPPVTNTFDQCDNFNSGISHLFVHSVYGEWNGGPADGNMFMGTVNFLSNIKGNILAKISLLDQRINGDGNFNQSGFGVGNPQNRLPDFYYFHPFLFFPNHFKNGDVIAQIYFMDWWIIQQEVDPVFTFTKNREISIEFSIDNQ